MLGQDQYDLPTSTQSVRRRYHLLSTSRLIKYLLLVAFALLTIAFWRRQDMPPTVARYLSKSGATGDITPSSRTRLDHKFGSVHGAVDDSEVPIFDFQSTTIAETISTGLSTTLQSSAQIILTTTQLQSTSSTMSFTSVHASSSPNA